MPLMMVRGVGPGINVLHFGGDGEKVRGSFRKGKLWNFLL